MKNFVFLLIGAFLIVQTIDAFPSTHGRFGRSASHFRRSTGLATLRLKRAAEFATSGEKELTKREELAVYSVAELLGLANFTVDLHRELFENVIKSANRQHINTGALRRELTKFDDFVKKVDNLPDAEQESEKYLDKLFDLFTECFEIAEKYDLDEIEKPTAVQRRVSQLLEGNGQVGSQLQFLIYFAAMQERLTTKIEEYINSLTPLQRKEDKKLITWYNKFKNEEDFDKKIDTMMEFFEFLENE